MKRWSNKSWIAGALVAVCVMAVVCVFALPRAGQSTSATQAVLSGSDSAQASSSVQQPEASTSTTDQSVEQGKQGEDPYGGLDYEEGIVLVTLPVGVSAADALATIADETGIEGLALANASDASQPAATAAEEQQLVEFSFSGDMPMQDAVALISTSSAVDAAQPNFIYYT